MEGDDRALRGKGHAPGIVDDLVLGGFEGEVEHGQGEHHLGEVVRGVGEVGRQEAALAVKAGIVKPEGAGADQAGDLLLDGQVVVVVLRPFLRRLDVAVKRAILGPFQFIEELNLCFVFAAHAQAVGHILFTIVFDQLLKALGGA